MKFINREKELKLLADVRQLSQESSRMTVLVGRRRVGKTRLIAESLKNERYLYFFVARKDEKLLCEEFVGQIREVLGLEYFGEINRFKDVFALLMDLAERQPLNLVIDEFQEFNRVNPAVFSEIQQIWDRKKDRTRMNLIVCGSADTLMTTIFENNKEPLFGRANERLWVRPFAAPVLQNLMAESRPGHEKDDLLAFYILTGGVPKYVEQFVDKQKWTLDGMLGEILNDHSMFLEEGKNVLIEEFGKEYSTYFSILSLLSAGKTGRGEVEGILQKDVGGYLNKLETEYQIIRRVQPILAKPGGKQMKYEIDDNFLHFWFRFLYGNRGAVEIGNFDYLKKLVEREYTSYSGRFLEKYFTEKLAATGEWSRIGTYWESGFKNQIDIVALNEMDKKALLVEVKRQPKHLSMQVLKNKSHDLVRALGGYSVEFMGLSLDDV